MMEISVIIPTHRRKERVLETLRYFSGQTHKDFEMIIVDQGPEFITGDEISKFNLKFPLKHVRLDEPNLGRARNAGVRNSRGDIILFCDDDIVPDRSLLEKHLENYKDDKVGGVGGRVISSGERKDRRSIKQLFPVVGSFNPLDASPICNFHTDKRCEVKHIKGCNMSFRKELLIKAGSFDESLAGTANLEDADMSFRIRKLGYKLLFEPDAKVEHLELKHGGCQMDDFRDLIYWLYFTDTLFYMRYFKRIFMPFFISRIFARMVYYVIVKADFVIAIRAKKGFRDAIKKYSEEKR